MGLESQTHQYESLYEGLIKLQIEYEKQMSKVIDLNTWYKGIMTEFVSTAQKHNNQKVENKKFVFFDEIFFQNFNSFFEWNERWLKNQLSYYTETFGRNSIYIKEYISSVKSKLAEWNQISSEFYKAKIALNEKKNKTILLDNSQWGISKEYC